MQSALSACNWPCQNCFSQTVSSSRLDQAAARSPVQETQLAGGGWSDETGKRKKGLKIRKERVKGGVIMDYWPPVWIHFRTMKYL